MRLRFTVILGLMLMLIVTVSQGEWKLQVHQDGETRVFIVSEIDSLTFHDDMTPPMVLIPAGTFTMGSPEDEYFREDDEAPHTVTLTTSLNTIDISAFP